MMELIPQRKGHFGDTSTDINNRYDLNKNRKIDVGFGILRFLCIGMRMAVVGEY